MPVNQPASDGALNLACRYLRAHLNGDTHGRSAAFAEVLHRDLLPGFLRALTHLTVRFGQQAHGDRLADLLDRLNTDRHSPEVRPMPAETDPAELDAVALWASSACPTCGHRGELARLAAGRWGVGALHAPDCPRGDDDVDVEPSRPAPVIDDDPSEPLTAEQAIERIHQARPSRLPDRRH